MAAAHVILREHVGVMTSTAPSLYPNLNIVVQLYYTHNNQAPVYDCFRVGAVAKICGSGLKPWPS